MPKMSSLASVSATRKILEAHGLATKHALGQNFLINDRVLQRILELSKVGEQDNVLEVGPGIGTLTIALLQHAKRVLAIERDADLLPVLSETTAPWSDRFNVVNMDALAFPDDDARMRAGTGGCVDGGSSFAIEGDCTLFRDDANGAAEPFKLISNLPYAVAATVVLDYFQRFDDMSSATVMVQREVADRMMAQHGTKAYGAYTVKLSLYACPIGSFAVGPKNFFPPPHVDSTVIRLDRRYPTDAHGAPLSNDVIRAACKMADAAFASRRKTIANSFKAYFAADQDMTHDGIAALLSKAGVEPRRRGETLTREEFISLGTVYRNVFV